MSEGARKPLAEAWHDIEAAEKSTLEELSEFELVRATIGLLGLVAIAFVIWLFG